MSLLTSLVLGPILLYSLLLIINSLRFAAHREKFLINERCRMLRELRRRYGTTLCGGERHDRLF
jgi:hypothetical protein